MKYKITFFTWIACIILVLTTNGCQMDPCGSAPADMVENMEDLVKEVKKVDYKPKDERWQSYDNRFNIYFDECYDQWRDEMTFDQKKQFTGLVARYMANRFGRSFFKSVFGNDEVDNVDTFEFVENLGGDLQKFLEDNKESGAEFLEDLKREYSKGTDGKSK